MEITGEGRSALEAVCDVALFTNDLSDVGLTAAESVELNRLLLKVVHATQGTELDGFYE